VSADTSQGQELPASPRLAALERELQSGDRGALDRFWAQVALEGTPLVEDLPDDPDAVLATFLWRAEGELRNVVVVSERFGWEFERHRMERLLDTDLWHKSYTLRRRDAATYALSPNDSLENIHDAQDHAVRMSTWRPDPLNRHSLSSPDRPRPDRGSPTLYTTSTESWIRPEVGVQRGWVTRCDLRSEILGNERPVWVYTPPGYDPHGEPCALLLLFDGWSHAHVIPTPTILDSLLAEGAIPPVVTVMLDSLDHDTRLRELACHRPTVRFLTDELMPWVRQRLNVASDPMQTAVGGASIGGLGAAYAALQAPHIFGNVLSQSGSYWWRPEGDPEHEWLARQFAERPKLPLRFYLNVGQLETVSTPGGGPTQLVVNRHLRDVLRAKGYDVKYEEFLGGHTLLCWRGLLAAGLKAVLAPQGLSPAA
jgi:enterochelin esterase family protein